MAAWEVPVLQAEKKLGKLLLCKGAAKELVVHLKTTIINNLGSHPVAPEESAIPMYTAVKTRNGDKCDEQQPPCWCCYLLSNSGTLFGPPRAGKILGGAMSLMMYRKVLCDDHMGGGKGWRHLLHKQVPAASLGVSPVGGAQGWAQDGVLAASPGARGWAGGFGGPTH